MILKRALLCILAIMMLASVAVAQDVIKDQVTCYTTWDSAYFYISFKIDSPDVQATHSKPNADITGDDSVEFYFETDNKHSMKITPSCFSMAVSAAGGSRFCSGSDKGTLDPTSAYTYKFGAITQGTLNNPDDIDMGYSVEIAIPWDIIKKQSPSLGDMMSFNVIVRRHGDKAGSFVSLSPRVKNEEDALVPAKWVNIVFAAHTFGVATTSMEKILSAKYVVRSPLIDGVINEREWHQNTSFSIDLPMPPGFVYEAKYPVQRMVLAKYLYWYQADPRKSSPVRHITKPDGSSDLVDIPAKGVGPWFSADRVQWHKDELSNMVTTGVSVALPDYLGAAKDGQGYADKGLDCMVEALYELNNEGKIYPMVGMYLDASSLGKEERDLKDEAVWPKFYDDIKSFYDRIPPEFRAYAPAAKPNAGRPGAIVYMAHMDSLNSYAPGLLSYCSGKFEKDYDCPLIWAGDSSFAKSDSGFDAVVGSNNSRISIESVTSDDSYDSQWVELFNKNPLWVFCDAWNDFTTGKCICATSRLGTRRVDSTKAHIKRFLVARDFSAKFLRFDVPKVISPKQIAQAEVTIRNMGNSTWRVADGYALGYRWYLNGRYYGESKVRRPLTVDVPPGDTITLNIGIATITSLGNAMPEGNCELRLELIRLSDNKWFSALGDLPLMLPITVGKPTEQDATYLSCSVPNMMAIGGQYPATIRVRNDGTQIWRASEAKLDCRLVKAVKSSLGEPDTEVPISGIHAYLTKDCKPGDIATFKMDLAIIPASKKSIDISNIDEPWNYKLQFDFKSGSKLSNISTEIYDRAVDLFDSDYAPRIVDSDLPASLTPGQIFEAKVVVRNNGVKIWDAKKTKIGYHWYSADGTELMWDGVTTPIKTKVEAGWPAVLKANVEAPKQEGKYILVWDVMIDGKWLSTGSLNRGGDILPTYVDVVNEPAEATESVQPAK